VKDTIKSVGEAGFLMICKKHKLTPEEIETVRKIFKDWDTADATREEMKRATSLMFEAVMAFPPEKRERIVDTVLNLTDSLMKRGGRKDGRGERSENNK